MGYKALTEAEPMESREMPTANSVNTEQPTEGDRAAAELEIAPDDAELVSDEVEPDLFDASSQDSPRGGGLSGWRGVALGLGVGVAVSVAGMGWMTSKGAQPPAKAPVAAKPANAQQNQGQAVTAEPVETASIEHILNATGSVAAYDMLPVLPQATGLQVKQVLVDEGDAVEAGQVMAILDDAVLRSQIDQAKAQVESARSAVEQKQTTIERAQGGLEQARASQSEAEAAVSVARASQSEAEAAVSVARAALAEAKAGREQANANLARAKTNLAQTTRELERYQQLANAGAISVQELDTRRTKVDDATEQVRVATANISGADAKIESATANVSSTEARVKSAIANVSSAEAHLQSAAASVSNARSEIDSARATVNSAQADVRSNEARVEQQQTQQEQTLVRAPKSGIVAERIARVGDVTGNGQKLFSIIQGGQLELQAKVPEIQLQQIKIGASVQVTSDADSRIQVQGTVREIAPVVDAQNRQATVKIDLPASELLRPGMFLKAAIATETETGLTVPANAVLYKSDGHPFVYVLQPDNIVQARQVEKGEIVGGTSKDLATAKVEIRSGLNFGDRVVVAGAGYLKDGEKVHVVTQPNLSTENKK